MESQTDLMRWALTGVLVLAGATGARADDIDLFKPASGFVIDDPRQPAPGEKVPTYSPTVAAPNWHIAQWNIPGGQLPGFTRQQAGAASVFVSQAAEANVRIEQAAGGAALTLSQDGTVLPCTTDAGRPRESDLFVAPSGQHPSPPSVPASTQPGGVSPPLSQMSALIQSIDVTVSTGSTRENKGCAVNQGTAMVAVILQDKDATPHQTFFYQFLLYGLCGPGPARRQQMCENGLRSAYWFFRSNPYGMNDELALAGGGALTEGTERQLSIDLLPRLTQAIAAAPDTMDHDMSHWRINSAYFGQNIWGDVTFRSVWRGYRLVARTNAGGR